MSLPKKLRYCLWGALATIFSAAILSMAIFYWFVQRDPDVLAKKYLSEISAATGLTFKFDSTEASLLPLPSIALGGVSITGKGIDFQMPWLSLRPDLFQVLSGNFFPGKITFLRPQLRLYLGAPLSNPQAARQSLQNLANDLIKDIDASGQSEFGSCLLEIIQGHMLISGADSDGLTINHIDCKLDLKNMSDIWGETSIASAIFTKEKKTVFHFDKLRANGHLNIDKFLLGDNHANLSGFLSIPELLAKSEFSVGYSSSSAGWKSNINFMGDFLFDGPPIPASITGGASGADGTTPITLYGWKLVLGNDHGMLDGSLDFADGGFNLKGRMRSRRLSLTQWLGFARNLTPGLQLALDNILEADVEFHLNERGLRAPRVSATCMGARFTGSGSVADFSRPVVALNLRAPDVNLGKSIPESLGKSPVMPRFFHAPLTPMPGIPLKEGETGIGYDIRLGAERVKYGPLVLERASLRISPGKLDKTGLEDVILDGQASAYGAPLKGNCILGADPGLPINIVGSARGMNGAALGKALSALPIRSGKYDFNVNVFSKGKKLAEFLENLKGAVSASGKNARLSGMDASASISAKTALRGGTLEKNGAVFNGKWSCAWQDAEFNANIEANGKVLFSISNYGFKNLPATLKLRFLKPFGVLGVNTEIRLNATASASMGKIELREAKATLPGLSLLGNASIVPARNYCQGNFETQISSLRQTAQKLGIKNVTVPSWLSSLNLSADFSSQTGQIKFSKIKAKLNNLNVFGQVSWQKHGARPFIGFDLESSSVDTAHFGGGKSSTSPTGDSWNFKFMHDFDAQGTVKIKNLRIFDLTLTDVTAPMRLTEGKLSVGPNSARFYGAPMQSRGFLDFTNGLSLNGLLTIHDFNLESAAKSRKIKAILKGRASIDANLNAHVTGPKQLARAINGKWSFKVANGSWQSLENGSPKGTPTEFTSASASGTLDRGLLKSSDFILRDKNMEVKGGGWINLATENLDCEFNVNMKGLPDFPLRLYGTLSNSKTSIGAGKMMLNAIGGITSSFVNLIGGLAEGTWNLFR